MITHAAFDDYFERKFWGEAVSTATNLDNMMVRHMGGKPPYYMFFKEKPNVQKIPQKFSGNCCSSQS